MVGAILGTLTFRYPISCSRWAPYVFVGGGGIFGGGRQTWLRLQFVNDVTGEVLGDQNHRHGGF